MKKFVLFFIFMLACNVSMLAQEETAKPLRGVEIVRKVSYLDIEGFPWLNAFVTLKSQFSRWTLSYNVKVTVKNEEGKTIWKKTLKNANLYVFSNGQVQVGLPNFNQIAILKDEDRGIFYGRIREREGVY